MKLVTCLRGNQVTESVDLVAIALVFAFLEIGDRSRVVRIMSNSQLRRDLSFTWLKGA
jgi:hypothetical protein